MAAFERFSKRQPIDQYPRDFVNLSSVPFRRDTLFRFDTQPAEAFQIRLRISWESRFPRTSMILPPFSQMWTSWRMTSSGFSV